MSSVFINKIIARAVRKAANRVSGYATDDAVVKRYGDHYEVIARGGYTAPIVIDVVIGNIDIGKDGIVTVSGSAVFDGIIEHFKLKGHEWGGPMLPVADLEVAA